MRFLLLFFMLNFSFLNAQDNKALVFHKTDGFYHNSIPTGIRTLKNLGDQNDFEVTATDDAAIFSEENLKTYNLVIFLNTTGNVLNENQEKAFEHYINGGGNFFGIHSAADTEYDWQWYGDLVGAYFASHPAIQKAEVKVVKPAHPTVAHLPETWSRTDEWYNYKDIHGGIEELLMLQENSYEGGTNGDYHPIAWFQELEGGGRAVYTGGGHTKESYSEADFREHLLQCIFFAMGE